MPLSGPDSPLHYDSDSDQEDNKPKTKSSDNRSKLSTNHRHFRKASTNDDLLEDDFEAVMRGSDDEDEEKLGGLELVRETIYIYPILLYLN